MNLPKLYVIADAGVLRRRGGERRDFCLERRKAGGGRVQWRDKDGTPHEVLAGAAVVREVFAGSECRLVMNDRADLALLAGFGGVHVGQGDVSPEDVRRVIGASGVIGVSTHTEAQVIVAEAGDADYVAIGPVFATGTKADAEAVVGLEGVRRARALTGKPLVAIGGITRENAQSVLEAGADSVAVISGLFAGGESVAKVVGDFLEKLR